MSRGVCVSRRDRHNKRICGTEVSTVHYLVRDMSIPVLLFASYADAFGSRRLEAPLATPCTVADLVTSLRGLSGGHVLPAEPLVAVNHTWVRADAPIVDGDEVAVIPPVAGG